MYSFLRRYFMLFLILLLFILAGGIFAVITVENLSTSVHLILFGWQTPELPVGLLILAAFLLGALLLYVVSFLSAWGDKSELRELHKRMSELEQQQTMQQRPPVAQPPMSPMHTNTSTLQMPGMFTPPKY
jgi:uncharacterized integral membrane protein